MWSVVENQKDAWALLKNYPDDPCTDANISKKFARM